MERHNTQDGNPFGEPLDGWMDRITDDLRALSLDLFAFDYTPVADELWIIGAWWETGAEAHEIAPIIRAALEGGAG